MRYLRLSLILLPLLICAGAEKVFAQVDPFEFEVFEYKTSPQGVAGLAWLNNYVPNGHSEEGAGTSSGTYPSNLTHRATLELRCGITNKIQGSIDLDLARPDAASHQYAASNYRIQGSLFEHDQFPLDVGWFVELGWLRTPEFSEDQLQIEFRPII